MASTRIRPATPADATTWEEMHSALWPDGSDDHAEEIASFFAGTLPEPDAVMIAETEDHNAVALLELSIRRDIPGSKASRSAISKASTSSPNSAATISEDVCSRNHATGLASKAASASPAIAPAASSSTAPFRPTPPSNSKMTRSFQEHPTQA